MRTTRERLLGRLDAIWPVIVRTYRERRALCVSALAAIGLIFRLGMTPFGVPVDPDVLWYLIKAREIVHGNLMPAHLQAIGWPLALAPIAALLPRASALTLMNASRVVTCVIGALIVVPTAWLTAKRADEATEPIAVFMSAFALLLVRMSVRGFAEPLLTLLLVGSVVGVLAGRRRPAALIAGGVCAGLAAWVHPTGIWILIIAVAAAATAFETGRRLSPAVTIAIVGTLVAAPPMVQRARAFGGPFEYGRVNPHLPRTTDMFEPSVAVSPRMLVSNALRGAGQTLRAFSVDVVHLPVLPFLLVGSWLAARRAALRPLVVAVAVFLAPWCVLYPLTGTGRHLTPIVPVALTLVAAGVVETTRRLRHGGTVVLLLMTTYLVAYSTAAAVQRTRALHDVEVDGITWGRWIAEHVKGRLAMSSGQELVVMHLPDARVGGVVEGIDAPDTGLSVLDFPDVRSVGTAMRWARAERLTHVALDRVSPLPPGFEALRDSPPAFFVERFSNDGTPTRWPMRVFEIRWDLIDAASPAAGRTKETSDPIVARPSRFEVR